MVWRLVLNKKLLSSKSMETVKIKYQKTCLARAGHFVWSGLQVRPGAKTPDRRFSRTGLTRLAPTLFPVSLNTSNGNVFCGIFPADLMTKAFAAVQNCLRRFHNFLQKNVPTIVFTAPHNKCPFGILSKILIANHRARFSQKVVGKIPDNAVVD